MASNAGGVQESGALGMPESGLRTLRLPVGPSPDCGESMLSACDTGTVSKAGTTDHSLRTLVDAIVANHTSLFSKMIAHSPTLATDTFQGGATRQGSSPHSNFLSAIGHVIYAGDTALHFAAASYRPNMVTQLIIAGANVRARNRRGCEPLHSASVGGPDSPRWNPAAQSATIVRLIEAGADPNAQNIDGATPLHRAVRTRCAEAVRTLLQHGADPSIRNKNGSAPVQLAMHTTGRGGSGSPKAKDQQQEILNLLQQGR
jgi:hypothetical protein